ncbi:unnamed protein product [Coccothraustes coccothraustes]
MSFLSVSDGDPGMGCSVGIEPTTVLSALANGFHCSTMPLLALPFLSLPCGVCPASMQPLPCCARGPSSAALVPAKSALRQCAVGVAATVGDRCHGGAAAARRAHASTFPTKLWRLVHSLCVCYLPCDIQAQGLLIICSLFQQELLSQSDACQAALYSFQATQFCSFVLQLHCYSFHRVPGWVGFAAPGNAGAWLHYSIATTAPTSLSASSAGARPTGSSWQRGHSNFQQLHYERAALLPQQAAAQGQ